MSSLDTDSALRTMCTVRDAMKCDKSLLHERLRCGGTDPAFQPVVQLADRTITSFVVLANIDERFKDMSSSSVIPSAGQAGLTAELTSYIIESACTAARRWRGAFRLAFKISTPQFQGIGLLAQIEAAVHQSGFPLSRVQLEIAECAVVDDLAAARAVFDRLKARGVQIALADFGTELSCLKRLQLLPFDTIEIDKRLFRSIGGSRQCRKAVWSIIGLGKTLGIPVVAQGVETPAQLRILASLGCRIGLGSLFCRPLTAAEIPAFIKSWSASADSSFPGGSLECQRPLRPTPVIDGPALEGYAREFTPRIRSLARKMRWRLPTQVDEEDLLQWGLLGLVQAAERYRGTHPHFWSFAVRRVRGAMLDGLRAADSAPRRLRRAIRQFLSCASKLEQMFGRPATSREIAAEAGVSLTQYHRMVFEHSIHEEVAANFGGELPLPNSAANWSDPLQRLLDQCAHQRLLDAIASLPPRDRMLLHLRLDGHLELRRIGVIIGVTESRVCQMLGATAAHLRSALAAADSKSDRRVTCGPPKKRLV